MENPTTEKELITYDDFVNWLEAFKNEVYNWEDPSGIGENVWEETYIGSKGSTRREGTGRSKKPYYGISPASFTEVRNMFKPSDYKFDYKFDYGTI